MTRPDDQFAELVRRGREVFAAAVSAWEQAARSLASGAAGGASTARMRELGATVDAAFDFAGQMLAEQRNFAKSLMTGGGRATDEEAAPEPPPATPDPGDAPAPAVGAGESSCDVDLRRRGDLRRRSDDGARDGSRGHEGGPAADPRDGRDGRERSDGDAARSDRPGGEEDHHGEEGTGEEGTGEEAEPRADHDGREEDAGEKGRSGEVHADEGTTDEGHATEFAVHLTAVSEQDGGALPRAGHRRRRRIGRPARLMARRSH